ncbi:uncharacterized protein I206_105208 [Kwoniella pini CBS 10737]|uniref:NADH dehydrogenase [ubiquinone] 1 alpha subcomplex subunit n=1 Tax=Kwoniella pini CBS 10737 TaxID=1296096 RepID=A0A1B9I4V9_9TREE|nr:uncharacterized protein I206_03883 [Kwoniella pini CBS 10737]OCF50558.1 hypothetical protein I206_03883 [Kwoniella pini CBS 10737]
MSGVFGAVKNFFRPKGLIGYDLQGNKYFEIPNPAGGRMKRFVQYKKNRDLAEYSRSELKPPVQWRAWLSHTRVEPPNLEELKNDFKRQENLQPKIKAIELREKEERIRQGYLLPDGSIPINNNNLKNQIFISNPSTQFERKAILNNIGKTSISQKQKQEQNKQFYQIESNQKSNIQQQQYSNSLNSEKISVENSYNIPKSTFNSKQNQTFDPIKHSSAEELRKLAMEDTKRRISQNKEKQPKPEKKDHGIQGVGLGLADNSGGLQPRRRGKI